LYYSFVDRLQNVVNEIKQEQALVAYTLPLPDNFPEFLFNARPGFTGT